MAPMSEARPPDSEAQIILLEDVDSDAELIGRTLRQGGLRCVLHRVESRAAYLALLQQLRPDFVLADYALPDFSGVAALVLLQQQYPDVPFILVSGAVGDERAVEILKQGATDYVLKDRLSRLVPAMRRAAADAAERRQRQAAEAALQAQTTLYETLLQAQSDLAEGVLLLDGDEVVYVNDAFGQIIGCPCAGIDMAFLTKLVHPEDLLGHMERFQRMHQGEIASELVEIRLRHASGQWVVVEVAIKRIDTADGRRVVCLVRDITARKQAEARAEAFAQKLEQSNQELQGFAFVASHDLREPLRKIQALGTRLQAKYGAALPPDGQENLRLMIDAGQRMERLIKDLLALSRVTTRAQPFTPVDLGRVARDVLSDLEWQIERSGAVVEVGPLPVVEADASQMQQLLQNLISNALKFHAPDVRPVIKVTCRRHNIAARGAAGQPAPNPCCQIMVADNGIGFDEQFLERIFLPFQRLHTAAEYEGTGIGLAICKKIVERHGGTLTAHSATGHGATFIVTLPRQQPGAGRGEGS